MARSGVSFKMAGVPGLVTALERIPKDIRRELEAVTRDTACMVQARAQHLAPVDQGDLRDSIAARGRGLTWRVGLLDQRLASRGGDRVKIGRRGREVGAVNSAHVNPSVYGVWYEYGFVTRGIPARPFMAPAAAEAEPSHAERAAAVLAKAKW